MTITRPALVACTMLMGVARLDARGAAPAEATYVG